MKTIHALLEDVRKKLGKQIPDLGFTYDQAIRVYLYTKAGHKIPGLSKTDLKELNDIVEKNPKLQAFADLQPDYVFGIAEQNLPNIKAANLRLKAAEKNQLVAKAGFYPTLSFGYSLSSNFSNAFK